MVIQGNPSFPTVALQDHVKKGKSQIQQLGQGTFGFRLALKRLTRKEEGTPSRLTRTAPSSSTLRFFLANIIALSRKSN
jgi:hypothetical protein